MHYICTHTIHYNCKHTIQLNCKHTVHCSCTRTVHFNCMRTVNWLRLAVNCNCVQLQYNFYFSVHLSTVISWRSGGECDGGRVWVNEGSWFTKKNFQGCGLSGWLFVAWVGSRWCSLTDGWMSLPPVELLRHRPFAWAAWHCFYLALRWGGGVRVMVEGFMVNNGSWFTKKFFFGVWFVWVVVNCVGGVSLVFVDRWYYHPLSFLVTVRLHGIVLT